ncbi:hypothetical protein AK812_SmicGene46408, partial [Symbiodinium microadriaticum]
MRRVMDDDAFDRTILKAADIAVTGPTTDGRSTYSAIEKATMAYVRKTYKFT